MPADGPTRPVSELARGAAIGGGARHGSPVGVVAKQVSGWLNCLRQELSRQMALSRFARPENKAVRPSEPPAPLGPAGPGPAYRPVGAIRDADAHAEATARLRPAAYQPAQRSLGAYRRWSDAGAESIPTQFDPVLDPREAQAACGPAAAVALARAVGKSPSLRQALEVARNEGWSPSGGMNGVANEKRLLEKMGVPVRLDTSGSIAAAIPLLVEGRPVIISTAGHYFVADGYDPSARRFHVGASGMAYRGGKEWMTRGEMEACAGRINGVITLDAGRFPPTVRA